MLTFNTDNMLLQEFPFPAPIMDYIFKNISAAQLLKLYKACKFFYDKFRLNIVEDFEICDDEFEQRIVGNSIAICLDNPLYSKLNNLWISKSFTYCKDGGNKLPIQMEYEKFSCLTYDTLHLFGDFSVTDYEFLVKPSTVRYLIVEGAIFYPDTGVDLTIAECTERGRQVSTIELSRRDRSPSFSPIDMKKLIAIERETKLTSFHLWKISQLPDPLLVIEFFKKHAIPNIDYYFGFDTNHPDYVPDNVEQFYKTIDEGIRAWKTSLQIPPAISSSFIDLTGKTAVITGASDGIGRATVILFRKLGASVIAISRNKFGLKSLNEECQNFNNTGFLHTVWTPFIFYFNIEDIFPRINCKFGSKFDIYVNNADTFGWGGIPDAEGERDYCHDVFTIVESHYNFLKEAKEYLKNSKGCIINVPYSDEFITRTERASFIAKRKQRINNIETKLVSLGVRVNIVKPGTPVSPPHPEEMNDIAYKKLLKDSKKSPDEQAANAIAFLASDAAKLINGSTLNVNPMNLR